LTHTNFAGAGSVWGAEVKFLEETDSTNRVAREWAQAGAPEGALVVADYQTAGRGRFDRKWFAPPGECLLFSLILRPDCGQEYLGLINLAAAVALCRSLAGEGIAARIKWPNDVMIAGRKAAGLLSETTPSGALGEPAVILGLGLNVAVTSFPPEIGGSATSLALEGQIIERQNILEAFLRELKTLYEQFPGGVVEAYRPLCDTLGANIQIQIGDVAISDKALNIDRFGALVLATHGAVQTGDVIHIKA